MRVGGVYMHHRVGYIYIIIGFIAITYRNYYEHVILEEYIKLVIVYFIGTFCIHLLFLGNVQAFILLYK